MPINLDALETGVIQSIANFFALLFAQIVHDKLKKTHQKLKRLSKKGVISCNVWKKEKTR